MKHSFFTWLLTAVLLSTISIPVSAQGHGYGAIIDDELSRSIPIKYASDITPDTKSISEVAPNSVMLVTPPPAASA